MNGFVLLLFAYFIWAFFPVYFKQMAAVASWDITAFRTLFTFVSMLPVVFLFGKGKVFAAQFCSPKRCLLLLSSGLLIGINWLVFVILVNNGLTLQASLGYYINPLITILLAMLFFRERFGKLQWTSIGIASAGVLIFAFDVGTLPWGSLCVAVTFGLYGMMKKISPVDALTSLTAETMLLSPFVLWYLAAEDSVQQLIRIDPYQFLWLFGAGAITGFTLILYGAGAQRCKLSTLGICQYITPTGQFLTAVLIFHEPMPLSRWFCFAFIWAALLLFTADSLRRSGKNNR